MSPRKAFFPARNFDWAKPEKGTMWLDLLASIVWPARCCGCRAFVDEGASFCSACAESVIPLATCCPGCAMPFEGGARCPGCLRSPFPFAGAFAALAYGAALTQALLSLKHGGHRELARPLGKYLVPLLVAAQGQGRVDVACPVPLHAGRLRQRGFNQALELLRAAVRSVPASLRPTVACDVLDRVVDTPPLGHGTPALRRKMLAGAFAVARPNRLAGKRILLVDDVMTTGATLAECSRTLLSAGAEKVRVLALARAL